MAYQTTSMPRMDTDGMAMNAPKTPQVALWLERHQELAARLTEQADRLMAKLGPVLRSEPMAVKMVTERKEEPLVPVAGVLRDTAEKYGDVARKLDDILHLLEV